MQGYKDAIEEKTLKNTFFRKVLHTGPHSQLVIMCLKPKEEIGLEVHHENDQFFRFEAGHGKVTINDSEFEVSDGDAVIVPAGEQHNIINTSLTTDLKFYTIYSPAHHPPGTIHVTKADALKAEAKSNL